MRSRARHVRSIAALIVAGMLVIGSCQQNTSVENSPDLTRACAYLWDQQGVNGSWQSTTHSLLQGGQALTPFILWTLLQVPDSVYAADEDRIESALNFIREQVDRHGALGFADPDILEYPNYASAYALKVLYYNGDASDSARIRQLQNYLVGQQFDASRGIHEDHPAFGGWGFGEKGLPAGATGHVDLSHTRRVLDALVTTGIQNDSIITRARKFLDVVQKAVLQESGRDGYDGGFYYSPVVLGANKAHMDSTGTIRSYTTATCDGYLALKLAGHRLDRQQAAIDWIKKRPSLWVWQHIPEEALQWSRAMRFYHLMVRSEVYRSSFTTDLNWQKEILKILAREQRKDGSFINEEGMISKENDPLLATAMALTAALNCYRTDKWVPIAEDHTAQ